MSERPVRSLHERPEDNHDPPIGDYGVIGNCRTAGLVSKGGSLDWLCLPNFSGPAVFAALLDRARGGRWTIRPDQPFEVERSYVNDTNVLETRFRTASGEARLVDLMPLRNDDAPRELAPDHEVLRIIEGTAGEVTFEVTFEPRPDYGRAPVRVSRRGRCTFACDFSAHLFLLHAERPLEHDPERAALSGQVTVRAGERCRFSLAYMHGRPAVIPALGAAADQRLEQTRRWWQGWSERCRYGGPFRPQVVRSILALKLLTFVPSGAMLAAATASLPERPGGSDNFDYRYCWVRDSALAVRAFVSLGYQDEADAFMRWLLNATRLSKPRLQVMYDVTAFGRATWWFGALVALPHAASSSR